MSKNLNAWQMCKAAGITRAQLNQWLTRGHFKPQHEPEIGKARPYSIQDAVTLGTLAELIRLGVPHDIAAVHCRLLYGFKDEPALLVVYNGPTALMSPSEFGSAAPEQRPAVTVYDPGQPALQGEVIRLSELPAYATNPDVRSLALVNLNEVEKRVLQATITA